MITHLMRHLVPPGPVENQRVLEFSHVLFRMAMDAGLVLPSETRYQTVSLLCPVSRGRLRDPVQLADGRVVCRGCAEPGQQVEEPAELRRLLLEAKEDALEATVWR